MSAAVHFSSLDSVVERVVSHIQREHSTAFVGSPGCGTTTCVTDLAAEIAKCGYRINRFDARVKDLPGFLAELAIDRKFGEAQQVVILDHVADLPTESFQKLLGATSEARDKNRDIFLWCGRVDARASELCSVPSAHVSFPVLSQSELLSAYRHIASEHGCRWGDAVLYLLLDLCGTDLLLARSIAEYLPGDWSGRLYDDIVWDRIGDWLKLDEKVDAYRSRLAALRKCCAGILALVRFGGKPECKRSELIEEPDDGLRRLCLEGFLAPNLLPGFYQLRNLVVRYLLDESMQPEFLFRRATNERANTLIQDAETMLRQLLASVFTVIGVHAAKELLQDMQQPGVVIEVDLARALLKGSREAGTEATAKALTQILTERREAFKAENSVWAGVNNLMEQDKVADTGSPHLKAIEYLTFDQLSTCVIGQMESVFPRLIKDTDKKRVRDGWLEAVAKIRRLRNQVAHLRNIGFQDMEDLSHTLERMRRDVIEYGAWMVPPAAAIIETEQIATGEEQ